MTPFAVAASILAAVLLVLLWQQRRWADRRLRAAADETGRLRAAIAELHSQVARLGAALAGAEDGLIVLDREGRIVATNPAAREFAALPEEVAGRRLVDAVPWPSLHDAVADALAGRDTSAWELDDDAANGRTLAIRVAPLADGVVIGIDDRSRVRRLESLRRDFVANVSHELKTPLAAIQGFVETMLDDLDMPAPTRHRFLERIGRQAERLATLVGDLLTLSRLDEPGARPGEAPPCNLATVLAETVRDLLPLAERRRLTLTAALPEEAVWVRAEREALRQVAGNLIDNAIKYTPEGGKVGVTLTASGEHARLEVADTGIGLSADDQERVFERFYRVDRARSRDVGGTGLGLSIVKNTVKNLGGEVGVRSRLGAGSTFWVELPRIPPPDADLPLAP